MAICCGSKDQYLISHKNHHVGKGWWPIIDQLHVDLMKIDPGYVTVQVKEKFGTLRVYIDGSHEANELAWKYEKMSESVCEICGKSGKLHVNGWYRTLCDEDEERRKTSGLAVLLRENELS
jgi:hypothetical protein